MPTKEYINGSGKFRILLIDSAGGTETLDFSFNYTALNEYDQGIATRHIFSAGNKRKLLHFSNLIWECDFSGLLLSGDAVLINKVKNAEYEGKTIWLIPHIETAWRVFKVQIIEDSRKLGQYYNNDQTGANKDYVIMFENVDAINYYNWIDPDFIPFATSEDILIIN